MTDSLSIAVHAFANHVLMSFSVDETLLPRYVNLSTSVRESPFSVVMSFLWLKLMYAVLSAFTWRPMPSAAHSRLCSRDSAWQKLYVISIVCIRDSFCGISSTSCFFSCKAIVFHWIYRRPKYVVQTYYERVWCKCLLSAHLRQCQRSEWTFVFYRASLWLRGSPWVDHRLEVFTPSSLCVWC